jgi:trimeric autotransporter adhesin
VAGLARQMWIRGLIGVSVAAMAVGLAVGGSAGAYPTSGYTIWTIAGNGTACSSPDATCGDGGQATAANLGQLTQGVAVDHAGNVILSDTSDLRIRRIAPSGTITTIAGNGIGCASSTSACGDGGPATAANLGRASCGGCGPIGVAVDDAGNVIVADVFNNRVRRFTPGGNISTIAGTGAGCPSPTAACGDGGPATAADLTPTGVAVDGAGDVIVADNGDNRIRMIAPNGKISTIAGTGTPCASSTATCGDGGAATSADLHIPTDVKVDNAGDVVVSDTGDNRIRRFAVGGSISTIAGTGTACPSATALCGDGGPATTAGLTRPNGIAIDGSGNVIVADGTNRIRRFAPGGNISTIAGTGNGCVPTAACGDGGAATAATFSDSNCVGCAPLAVAVDPAGNVVVDDSYDAKIRWLTGPQAGLPGPGGPSGQPGAAGPPGASGRIELVSCKTIAKTVGRNGHKHKVKRQKCKGRLVSGPVSFTTDKASGRASVSRAGVIYASGQRFSTGRGQTVLMLSVSRRLTPGNYTLITGHHRQQIRIG